MSHFKFCLFALFAVILAVSLSDAAPNAALDAEMGEVYDAQLYSASMQTFDFGEWRQKVSNCVNRVDKHALGRGEVEVLLRCVMAAVAVPPPIPQAIAMRYVNCVVGGSVSGPLRIAAKNVAQCVRNS